MNIFYGGIAWRDMHVANAHCFNALVERCAEQGILLTQGMVTGDALVDRARNIAASAFLRSGADVLLTVDSDIWYRAQDAVKVCQEALELGIVGGLYMTRSLHTQPAMMLPDGESVAFHAEAKPVEVPFLSTGFMAVRRDVIEKLAATLPHCHVNWESNGNDTSFWPFYMPFVIPWPGDEFIYLSEDWAFCQRAKDIGYKVYVDPSIRLGHFGEVMFTLEDLLRPARPSPQPLLLQRNGDGQLKTEVIPTIG